MSLNRHSPLWFGLAALIVAYVLAWGLAPDNGPGPGTRSSAVSAAPSVEARIGPDVVERAERYRSRGRRLFLAGLALQFAVLALFAFYRGPPVRQALDRAAGRPLLGSAAVGFTLALVLAIVQFPLRLAGFDLGREVGLVTQARNDWLLDVTVSALLTASLAAIAALVAVFVWRRFGPRFWIAGSALAAVGAVIVVWAWPVVVSPIFGKFESLPDGANRDQVERLAARAGVEVGKIQEVDSSRRSSAINAYVNGIGNSKQVVIYDNAIRKLTPAELSALIAHELAHVKQHDLYRGLAFAILVIPLAVLFVQVGTAAAARRSGDDGDPGGPGIVPALALMTALAALFLSFPGNMLSRSLESRADREALELTSDPDGQISLQVQLSWANISDPDPPGLYQFLFRSHPSTADRIETAESWPRPGPPDPWVVGGPVRVPGWSGGS